VKDVNSEEMFEAASAHAAYHSLPHSAERFENGDGGFGSRCEIAYQQN
jgi:hypothetical protein